MTCIANRKERGLKWTTMVILCIGCCYLIGCNQPPAPPPVPAPLPSKDEINRIRFSGALPYGDYAIVEGEIVNRLDEVLEALKPNSEVSNPAITLGGVMTLYYKNGGSAHIQFIGTGNRNEFLGFETNGRYYHGGSKAKLRRVLTTEMKRIMRDPKLPPLSPFGDPG
jgi:hypothetical protein